MKTIATYKITFLLNEDDEDIKEGITRLINKGKSLEEIEQDLNSEVYDGLTEYVEEESGSGWLLTVEKIEDLPF